MESDLGRAGESFVLRLLEVVGAQARELAEVSLLSLSVREKAAALDGLARARRALEAAHLSVVRSLEGEDLAPVGGTSVSGFVSARLRVAPGRARADVAAARATDPDDGPLVKVGAALAEGAVSMGHVDVAVAVLEKVPHRLRRQCAPVIEEFVVAQSRRYRPKEVANLAAEILDRVDPDRHERGYDPEAFARRSFTVTADAYGMGLPSGQLDPMTTALLETALGHYGAPTPAQRDAQGRLQLRDERTPAQRRCDALAEIARRALAAAGAGSESGTRQGQAPRVVVHATPEQLQDLRGSVECEATGTVPAAFLTRVLCDCVLERVLLAPGGAVLDLGRSVRTATPAQRRALGARDRGCVWPGCTIPARWCEVHHVPGWVHGSRTDVAEMALVCGAHHSQVEAGHYRVTMVAGVPQVVPPPWVDPGQTPVRNTYWQDKRDAAALGDQLRIELGIGPPQLPPRRPARVPGPRAPDTG